jgi:hypothetical protein
MIGSGRLCTWPSHAEVGVADCGVRNADLYEPAAVSEHGDCYFV